MSNYNLITKELQKLSNPLRAQSVSRFFKTKPGQYGENEIFIGITTPQMRDLVKKYKAIVQPDEIQKLIEDKIHEYRMLAVNLITSKYIEAKTIELKKFWYDFYLSNLKHVNNWDLVDSSASAIVGDYIHNHSKNFDILKKLSDSKNLWEKRVAIVSTNYLINKKSSGQTYKLAEKFLDETHDLMHKACGWMLRECGKKVSESELKEFLTKYKKSMPRTMLRYAIEKFSPDERKKFLAKDW
ncbi:MAG: DNA alkylation repair protein [Niabella sp.]|nr:MAG: DNA alkylation repair protein [Niabella sp.]